MLRIARVPNRTRHPALPPEPDTHRVTLVLVSTTGDRRFQLSDASALVAGRDLTCDLPILDPGVSRRHAEVIADANSVRVTDLGSRNGTWVNGAKIATAHANVGDTIAFGSVMFTLFDETTALKRPAVVTSGLDGTSTVIRERAVTSRDAAVAEIAGARFATLITLAQRLGGPTQLSDLMAIIVNSLFAAFEADRVAVLLRDATGALETRVARDRQGTDVLRTVPRAIADGVAERRVALLSHDALDDDRTAGESVQRQAVRSAMAAPLIAANGSALGVLYVDNVRSARAFTDDDLHFLVAFAGIAAAAVERETAASQLRRAAHIRENFERYFTPQVAERIASSTQILAPGGHRQRVVVLFSDIRGFTAIAESLPPQDMAAQLNEYFGAMVDCVFAQEGALDKFIGDALLAYWGAPAAREDDAQRALTAATAMRRALDTLNARWRREGRPELHAGIAIHSGEAFLGNIGSPRRLEFTLIGDTVNLTSKLCGLARADEILITESARAALPETTALIERPDVIPERRAGGAMRVWDVPA